VRVIDGDQLRALVPMERAVDAVVEAFRSGGHETPPRQHLALGDADLLFMPSWNERVAGVKLVTVNANNPPRGLPLINGSYLLFDRDTLQPTAVIEAATLTAVRTAAVSGAATRALARPDARRLVIFGSGVQARSHLEAMVAVRPIEELVVVARSEERATALLERGRELGLDARAGDATEVGRADVLCTCTTSPVPLFDGAELNAGAHVNAVGSYRTDARELAAETIRRAAVVCVETLEVMRESGDLAMPLSDGTLDPADVIDLRTALGRRKPSEPEITVFKSVGQAFEDLAIAEAALVALD
jgi:ornithine cyclodeaminase